MRQAQLAHLEGSVTLLRNTTTSSTIKKVFKFP